ncbi:hypothetical protein [Leptothoe spongobia]|uniref:Uncharacterized protein n=1 Tax=Leptothoe spongobia TAU-MAC 1115 TaxID=1967444 RepID=A0A947GIY8_9CYAN|nr:hypothetical protein [Leptothoe spongobia]MBT9316570.1 hypothetical protein [Leptothoe spongobia TAU-MAC 1115]
MCLGSWGALASSAVAQESILLTDLTSELVELVQDDQIVGLSSPELLEPEPTYDPNSTCTDRRSFSTPTTLSVSKLIETSAGRCKCQKQASQEKFWQVADGHDGDGRRFLDSDEDREPESSGDQQPDDDDKGNDELGDDELGILRVRAQPVGLDSELGLLRVRQNNPNNEVPLEVEPEPTRQTSVFLTARSNVYGGNNLFRTPNPIDDRIYQAGVGIFAFPRLSDRTNLVISAEANLARYEDLSVVDYNELQFQAGIRQRLGRSSYGQLNWRFQDLSTPGSDSFFTANYIELLLSRRDILSNRVWLDTYYQARLSQSDPKAFSRFSHIATGSLNYGFDPQTRVSLLYQLFLDDYTEIVRFDTYHQVLAQVSHDLSSTTRLSLFTGFRFGDSSLSVINFDDTIYGASINVNVPLF